MPIIITATLQRTGVEGSDTVYDYSKSDKILENKCKREFEVYYSGQNKGILDYQLINAIQNRELFKVYYRPKKGIPYTYLGSTYNSQIIQNRTFPINVETNPDQTLKIRLIINKIYDNQVPIHSTSRSGKYKKDVLYDARLRDRDDNSIIKHNRNTNIGFYHY